MRTEERLTWTSFCMMAVACCCKGTWITCSGLILEVEKGIAKGDPAAKETAGLGKYPMLPSGKIPGTVTPAESNGSAGWSHFLFFLQNTRLPLKSQLLYVCIYHRNAILLVCRLSMAYYRDKNLFEIITSFEALTQETLVPISSNLQCHYMENFSPL